MKHRRWLQAILLAGCTLPSQLIFADSNEEQFESPVCIKAGGDFLNSEGALLYPSPAIFDIDQDGKDELVVGTIFGEIVASKNTNSSTHGDPVWGKPEAVKTENGKELKLNNW